MEVSVKVKYLSCFIESMNKVKLLHYNILVDFALAPGPFSYPKKKLVHLQLKSLQ